MTIINFEFEIPVLTTWPGRYELRFKELTSEELKDWELRVTGCELRNLGIDWMLIFPGQKAPRTCADKGG